MVEKNVEVRGAIGECVRVGRGRHLGLGFVLAGNQVVHDIVDGAAIHGCAKAGHAPGAFAHHLRDLLARAT